MGLLSQKKTPFHMSAKPSVTDYITNIGWGRPTRWCRGRYLDLRSTT